MIEIKVKAKLIEVIQSPYSVNGNEGISYKLRFLVNDSEIWEIKSSKEVTDQLKNFVDKVSSDAIFEIYARKEAVTLKLKEFPVK